MRVLASLRHPNIISLISIFENEHELMLVMERAHGGMSIFSLFLNTININVSQFICLLSGELFDRIVNRGHFTELDAAVGERERDDYFV